MTYRYTKDPQFLATAQALADYFIKNLPSDYVPYWDFSQSGTAPRDSSAAAIAAAGLLELSKYVSAPDQTRYQTAALNIQASLSSSAYLGVRGQTSGILLHGAGNVPAGDYDKSLIFGDYYFIQSCYRAMPLPSAPGHLIASAGSANQVNLSWDAESGAVRYNVKRSTTSGGPYAVIAPPPVLITNSYTDSSVTAGSANYYYVVSATNVAGESANSNEVSVPANSPVPAISSIAPTNTAAGASFTLTVNGTNFVSSSVVNLNGKAEPTTLVSATQLTAAIPASDVASGGTATITVSNASSGAGASGAATLMVNDFTLSSAAAATVKSGTSVPVPVTITPSNVNGFGDAVTFSVSGLPSNVTASFSPASVTPGAAQASSTLTFTAAAKSQVIQRLPFLPRWPWPLAFVAAFGVAALLFLAYRASRLGLSVTLRPPMTQNELAYALGFAALLVTTTLFSGCGGAGTAGTTTTTPSNPSNPTNPSPTPTSQNYTVTITGQSGSDTKTTSLTLTVQ